MKISTEIQSISYLVGAEKAVEYVGKAGFDAWDFSLFDLCRFDRKNRCALASDHPLAGPGYLKFARELKQIGLDNGIVCNQSHAPFPVWFPGIRDSLKKAIECTAEAGGSICVIHPMNDAPMIYNTTMYLDLLPFAKDHGVKIATENMFNWDPATETSSFASCATAKDFVAHIEDVNDDYLIACLDIGHAEMEAGDGAVPMIEALGKHLQALHIHDNDQRHDYHQIPFSTNIDFDGVVRALKKIGYAGEFTLECNGYMTSLTADTAFEGVCNMEKAARKLANMFENCTDF